MHKHLNLFVFIAMALGVAGGCGPTAPESNLQGAASHGGVAFLFPSKKGCVEIGSEPAPPGTSRQNPRQIFAFFYQVDGTTPLATTPTDVKLLQGTLPPIPLLPQAEAGPPGKFVSKPGPFLDELRGVLEATIDGEKVEVPFVKR